MSRGACIVSGQDEKAHLSKVLATNSTDLRRAEQVSYVRNGSRVTELATAGPEFFMPGAAS